MCLHPGPRGIRSYDSLIRRWDTNFSAMRRAAQARSLLSRSVASSVASSVRAPSLLASRPMWSASHAYMPHRFRLPVLVCRCARLSTSPPSPARAEVSRILRALEEAKDSCHGTFEPTLGDDGVLSLNLGEKGWYSLQEQDGQLLLFSPITGAYHIATAWARAVRAPWASSRGHSADLRRPTQQARCTMSGTQNRTGGRIQQMATCSLSYSCVS